MAKTAEYTIYGSGLDPFAVQHVHKSLPIRRDSKRIPSDLRELYRTSGDQYDETTLQQLKNLQNAVPTTPNLPPTPPTPPVINGTSADDVALNGLTDSAPHRSTPATPINQNSPPTPDDTPPAELKRAVPRPFLGTQPSLASTHAESFRTAREEQASEDESVDGYGFDRPTPRATRLPARNLNGIYPSMDKVAAAASPLPSRLRLATPINDDVDAVTIDDPVVQTVNESDRTKEPPPPQESMTPRSKRAYTPSPARDTAQAPAVIDQTEAAPVFEIPKGVPATVRRGLSLRDRLKEADKNSPTASTEKLANIIGWNRAVSNEHNIKRMSGASTTSTIGAMVFESAPLPKKRTTIRKVAKHDSLRSASSPLPTTWNSSSESPHRLVHKKAKLNNENRWSYGSEAARSHSMSSSVVAPKLEVIKVAIIPERSSSLHSSAQSSKRHSLSGSSGRVQAKKWSDGKPPSSWQRKRTLSESQSERGRDPQQKPLIPPRASSLSAPTSRNTSRANSMTSEHFRRQRKEAETDLRRTLDRMETDRMVLGLRDMQQADETPSKPPRPSLGSQPDPALLLATPGTSEWAALRPQSVLETPFSQPSFQSASPELRDATTINFFPHNNHSLQLIEPNIAPESQAVREVRKHQYIKDDEFSTQSPLRHPRQAPHPPELNIVPPTPIRETGGPLESQKSGRQTSQTRSESFVQSLTRGFSLRNAQNRKKDHELDGKQRPFWRPEGFWEAFEEPHPKPGEETDMHVHNSLGMPQERTIITGPVSLVRRISQRRRTNQSKALMKQSSSGSLARLRASHKLYRTSILGLHFPFTRFVDVRDRVLFAKQRKETERRERIRQDIRGKIGKEVVRQGDSRFLEN